MTGTSSNYTSPEFDQLFKEFQATIEVDGTEDTGRRIQRLLSEDMPAAYPFF